MYIKLNHKKYFKNIVFFKPRTILNLTVYANLKSIDISRWIPRLFYQACTQCICIIAILKI